MANLTEAEKKELLRVAREPIHAPPSPQLTLEAWLDFATFTGQLAQTTKPVNFSGEHWKL